MIGHSIPWEDVAGVEEAKDELREVVEFLRDHGAPRLGARVAKGILLPPSGRARRCWPGGGQRGEREVLP